VRIQKLVRLEKRGMGVGGGLYERLEELRRVDEMNEVGGPRKYH
jgi:hypothetical protein